MAHALQGILVVFPPPSGLRPMLPFARSAKRGTVCCSWPFLAHTTVGEQRYLSGRQRAVGSVVATQTVARVAFNLVNCPGAVFERGSSSTLPTYTCASTKIEPLARKQQLP